MMPVQTAVSTLRRPSRSRVGRALRAFIFDVDGVIADTAELHVAAWRAATGEAGISFAPAVAPLLRGESRERSLELILNGRAIEPRRFAAILTRKNEFYVDSLQRLSRSDLLPGIEPFIAGLRARGLRIAAVSASRNARTVLTRVKAIDWFDAIVDGSHDQTSPPCHRFVIAAGQLGEPPRACVVVEDSPANIELACGLGMKTVAVGPLAAGASADFATPSLHGLKVDEVVRFVADSRN